MKTRWKILLAIPVFLVLCLGLALLTIRVGPANDVEAYKNKLRSQGEKLTIAEVTPAAMPADQNGRTAAESALTSFGSSYPPHLPGTMWMIAPGKAMPAWAQPDVRGSDFTNSWDDFADEVSPV